MPDNFTYRLKNAGLIIPKMGAVASIASTTILAGQLAYNAYCKHQAKKLEENKKNV